MVHGWFPSRPDKNLRRRFASATCILDAKFAEKRVHPLTPKVQRYFIHKITAVNRARRQFPCKSTLSRRSPPAAQVSSERTFQYFIPISSLIRIIKPSYSFRMAAINASAQTGIIKAAARHTCTIFFLLCVLYVLWRLEFMGKILQSSEVIDYTKYKVSALGAHALYFYVCSWRPRRRRRCKNTYIITHTFSCKAFETRKYCGREEMKCAPNGLVLR
jgi:hypothetical protein